MRIKWDKAYNVLRTRLEGTERSLSVGSQSNHKFSFYLQETFLPITFHAFQNRKDLGCQPGNCHWFRFDISHTSWVMVIDALVFVWVEFLMVRDMVLNDELLLLEGHCPGHLRKDRTQKQQQKAFDKLQQFFLTFQNASYCLINASVQKSTSSFSSRPHSFIFGSPQKTKYCPL